MGLEGAVTYVSNIVCWLTDLVTLSKGQGHSLSSGDETPYLSAPISQILGKSVQWIWREPG